MAVDELEYQWDFSHLFSTHQYGQLLAVVSLYENFFARSDKLRIMDGRWKKERLCEKYWYQWERCNAIVLSWLMNAVTPNLISGIAYATNAHAVWMDLQDRFDKLKDLWDKAEALEPSPGCDCVT
ncbi:PREDICTED: uncharacterized protein LOC109230070 [Nicotiana attenuata]|uniref:uncharacterized protein LOC109230070 n=1 Tax=Nicotiana attenuata TaxID=49451 RepID=UPI000904A9DF|nr:PREDICTED: uncharacterized protein LOC109230070 [Nicotiana attenuata]